MTYLIAEDGQNSLKWMSGAFLHAFWPRHITKKSHSLKGDFWDTETKFEEVNARYVLVMNNIADIYHRPFDQGRLNR